MKYCKNCCIQDWCKLVYWFGSRKTIYKYVKEYKIDCHHYKRKWWKFWIKEE